MNKAIILLAFTLAMFFTACDKSPKPEEVAEKYFKASVDLDFKTARSLSTEKHKKELDKGEKKMDETLDAIDELEKRGKRSDIKIVNEVKEHLEHMKSWIPKTKEPAKIDGNSAILKFYWQGKKDPDTDVSEMSAEIHLVKENDVWKVDKSDM
jgi:hypothetical protein